MPVHSGKDSKGSYMQWGQSGAKYYYTPGNDKSRKNAEKKAYIQGIAAMKNGAKE